jgi:hypothetical protein
LKKDVVSAVSSPAAVVSEVVVPSPQPASRSAVATIIARYLLIAASVPVERGRSARDFVAILRLMSPFAVVLLIAAAALVVGAEWSRFSNRFGKDARRERDRARRKKKLRVVEPDSEEFARAVERDLAALPTIDEHDAKRRW